MGSMKWGENMNIGFGKRALAWIIDFVVTELITVVITLLIGVAMGMEVLGQEGAEISTISLITIWFFLPRLFEWLYFAFFESSKYQATPGKMVFKIVVTDTRGGAIGFGRATARYFSKWVGMLVLGLGILPLFFTKRKQTAHDLFAGTVVVDKDCCEHTNVTDFEAYTHLSQEKIKKIE